MRKMRFDKKSIAMFILLVVIISGLIIVNFYVLYHYIKNNMIMTRENEVLQAAAEADHFLIESVDAVKMAAYEVDGMQEANASADEILDYLTRESEIYTKAIDENFTGLYGVFDGKYLDGIGWVPEPGYVAEERPWYTAAVEEQGDVAWVTPYLDSQTGSVMMSISQLLSDGTSVVSLDISLDGIQAMTEDNAAHHMWKCAMILDSDSFVVAHSDAGELGKKYLDETGSLGNAVAKGLYSATENHFEIQYDGKSYMVFKADMGDDWYALAVMNEGRLLGSLQTIYIIFFVSLILIFGVIASVFGKIEQKQRQAENLNRQIKAMANIYAAVRLIDLLEDSFTMVSGGAEDMELLMGERQEHAQNALRATMDVMSDRRFKKTIFDFVNFATLRERLEGKSTITKEYIDSQNRRCRARFVPVEWNEDGTLRMVMWMVEIIDDRSA